MTLDLETGEYEEMFELEFALDDGRLAARERRWVTRFSRRRCHCILCDWQVRQAALSGSDSEQKICFDTELEVKANAGGWVA